MIGKDRLDAWEERLSSLDPLGTGTGPLPPFREVVAVETGVVAEVAAALRDLGYDYLPSALDAAVLRGGR